MEACCDLEVEVDGETFMVDKKIIASFCGKIRKMFNSRVMGSSTRNVKLVFHDFPGGAAGFELVARFCYNNGTTDITPSNSVLLNCAAAYMEMESDGLKSNLRDQIKFYFKGISFWTWSELLVALKECQQLLPASESSFILEKVLDCIVSRVALPIVASPCTSSSDNSSFKCSSDMRSSYSFKSNWSHQPWWFEDLLMLNVELVEKVMEAMLSHNLDNGTICKFLLYYQKSTSHSARPAEKRKIAEVLINLLSRLDKSSLSCKLLFYLFRTASCLVISKYSKDKLESLIGSHLHQASIDHLLVPSPRGKKYIYDVNLVLRLVAAFCMEGSCWLSPSRLKKVASLVDSYLVEVAADPNLRPSKFAALVLLLPDYARESHDKLCQAMELYLQVHKRMQEEENLRICSALNYEKLSRETLRRLARYPEFPSRISVQAFINRQSNFDRFLEEKHDVKPFNGLLSAVRNVSEKEDIKQMVLCARRLNSLKRTEKVEAQLQGTRWKVTQLEEIYGVMHSQMDNISRTRLSSLGNNARYLPKLCS